MAQSPIWRRLLLPAGLVAHSIFLLFASYFLMSTDYMHEDEAWMVKNTAAVLRTLLPEPGKPDRDEFAFINISHDLQLIERTDADGFPGGNQAITDRHKLYRLFRAMNQAPNWKLMLCDIFFESPSPHDSLLNA
ncbi:MAG: hypothetical protein AAF570_27375, partial [Bacteroidota bacterium]